MAANPPPKIPTVTVPIKPKPDLPSYFEMTDAERAKLTPTQLRKYGSDTAFDSRKKGGMVSSRADGIAQRGKTRGKLC
jgi:hypothetical protein